MTNDLRNIEPIIQRIVGLEYALRNGQFINTANWNTNDWFKHRLWESETRRTLNELYRLREIWEQTPPLDTTPIKGEPNEEL